MPKTKDRRLLLALIRATQDERIQWQFVEDGPYTCETDNGFCYSVRRDTTSRRLTVAGKDWAYEVDDEYVLTLRQAIVDQLRELRPWFVDAMRALTGGAA